MRALVKPRRLCVKGWVFFLKIFFFLPKKPYILLRNLSHVALLIDVARGAAT